MRVCFYLNNKYNVGIDYSIPEKGNPGIGGTQYMVWTISYYLNKLYKDIEVIVLANRIESLPKSIKCYECSDLKDSIRIAKQLNSDIFIFENVSEQTYKDKKSIYNLIDELELNSIMWAHVYSGIDSLRYAADCKYLKRYICVSKEQYDRIMDHDISKKTTYIYNALDFSIYDKYTNLNNNKENIICYMGAIDPVKGFHKLTDIWPKIEKQVPNVKLHVIGGGNLYSSKKKLGDYGIAEELYEKRIMKNLTKEDGSIKDNVKFFGVLNNEEKFKVMSQAKIGIANPSGIGETFCIVAIEFEALGVPVITAKKNGLLDTVSNRNTGLLSNNKQKMIKDIDYLMKDNINIMMSKNAIKFVREKFDIYEICKKWKGIFDSIYLNKPNNNEHEKISNILYDLKFLKVINKNIKKIKLFKKNLSILEYRVKIANLLKLIIKK